MNKLIPLLATIAMVAVLIYFPSTVDREFSAFTTKFNREYSSPSELSYRKQVFAENLRSIVDHNSTPNKTFTVTVNNFTDFTLTELKHYFTSRFQTDTDDSSKCPFAQPIPTTVDSIDWTKQGKVFAVKDQKHCGSCWAFSATGVM